MRKADRFTIEKLGISGFTLMETAGRAAAGEIERRYGAVTGRRFCIVCGKGNNGGDGLVIARVLAAGGAVCSVVVPGAADSLSEDAGRNLRILHQIARETKRVTIHHVENPAEYDASASPEFVIDALLGTGLSQPLRSPISDWVAFINDHDAVRIAVDVPTGINSDTGECMGDAVRADLTVTMGALKAGLLMNDGISHAGSIHVAEIGIPRYVLDGRARDAGCGFVPERSDVAAMLPERPSTAHKYSVGLVVSVTGSRDFPGAAFMASSSAARIGSGAVICATASGIRPILQQKFTEVMVRDLPETDGGSISNQAVDILLPQLEKAGSMVVGCGLGMHSETQEFVRNLLTRNDLPVVIDADGLNAIAGHLPDIARTAHGRWVLTPHMGEFRRLVGDADVSQHVNQLQLVGEYARLWNVVLVLKGNPALVGTPSGKVFVIPGHKALAAAGTGDILAGACAGLLAQGLEPENAAICALAIGREAATRYSKRRHASTMLAEDLLHLIPLTYKAFAREKNKHD